MLKKFFNSLLFLTITLFILSIIKINVPSTHLPKLNINKISFTFPKALATISPQEENIYGKLIIKKLHINNFLYLPNSPQNDVDKNITILNESISPTSPNSIIFLAAHSGSGPTAYFKDLNKLQKGDEIILDYQQKEYLYEVTKLWEIPKTGSINVAKDSKNQLVLTTCSPTNKSQQLIVNALLKTIT